jgi:hypothetical protein
VDEEVDAVGKVRGNNINQMTAFLYEGSPLL